MEKTYKKLSSLVNRKIGYGIVQPGDSVPNGVPVIKVFNILAGLKSIDSLDTTKPENAAKYSRTKLNGGELIVSVVGTVGRTAIVPMSFAGCNLVRATALVDIPDETTALWVKYYIDSPGGQLYIDTNLNTTVQPTLNIKSLESMPIPFFEGDYMEKAVSILSRIDEKIKLNTAINDNLEQQAQEIVKKYHVQNQSVVTLGSIMSFVNGFAFQSSSYLANGKYRIITIKNVQDGKISSENSAYINEIPPRMKYDCLLNIGDVLLSLTGNVGRVGIVCEDNLLLNQRVAKIIPKSDDLLPYLYFYFRLPESKLSLETIAKGTAQQNLSPVETLKLFIPYDEKIAKICPILSSLFNKIIENQKQNISLSALRDALLPKLMSGEIDVSAVRI